MTTLRTLFRLVLVLVAASAAAAYALAEVYAWASPRIATHRQEALERAVREVLPVAGLTGRRDMTIAGRTVYAVTAANGCIAGWAIPAAGNGFQGTIGVMIGVAADGRTLTGLAVLESVETPGLGDRVCEPGFTSQFAGLAATGAIRGVKNRRPDAPLAPGEIDAITGATISSAAVVRIANAALAEVRPGIARRAGVSVPPRGSTAGEEGN